MLQVNPEFGAVIGVEIGETGVRWRVSTCG